MEQSVTRVSGMGKVARVLLVALLSLVGLSVIGVGQAAAAGVTVSSLTPATGSANGATSVVIAGTGFGTTASKVSVTFGGVPATSFALNSGIQITAVAPAAAANSPSTVEVVVTVSGVASTPAAPGDDSYTYTWSAPPTVTGTGTIPVTSAKQSGTVVTIKAVGTWTAGQLVTLAGFTNGLPAAVYAVVTGGTNTFTVNNAGSTSNGTGLVSPSSAGAVGPVAGGGTAVITGTNFGGASAVDFGSTPATTFTVDSATEITATAPAGAVGPVDITVTTPASASASPVSPATDTYSYVGPPVVAGLTTTASPAGGPAGGGTQVTIAGSSFNNVTAVNFGSTPATSFLVNGLNSITAVSPVGTGTVDVTVVAGGQTSATGAADKFAYNSTLTVADGNAAYSNSPGTEVPVTATSQTGSTVTITVAGTWTAGESVGLAGFTNGITDGTYTVLAVVTGGFTITYTPVLTGSGTGNAIQLNTASPTSVTATSQSGTTVTLTAVGSWFAGQQVFLTGFTNGLTAGDYAVTGGTSGSFTITFTPTLSASGTGTAIPFQVQSFNAATLITGGGTITPGVTVTQQPASGKVTVSGNQLLYEPAQGNPTLSGTSWLTHVTTAGAQTATFQVCETTPSALCTTATITYTPSSSGYFVGNQLSALGLEVSVVEDTGSGIVAPANAAAGSTFTTVTAPNETDLPSTNSGFTVTGIGGYRSITPVPTGVTLVPGTLAVTGGDAATTGKFTATLCTAPMGFVPNVCTANFTGNFKTTYPYIETSLNVGTQIAGGSQLSLPTVSATWQVTASSGSISSYETEFVVVTNVVTIGSLSLDAFPSNLASYLKQGLGAPAPVYASPPARWTVNITGGGPTAPGAPTGVSATPGNASASVSWTAPASDGGSAITGYTVTSSPGSKTCTTTGATSCTVNGLTNGTSYTFTVTATNAVGTGAASDPSTAVTPATVPGAPTGASALAGNASAVVSWTAPASDGGSAITGYTVTSSPGALTCTTTGATTCTVNGLTNGTPYTFTVTATNAIGTGSASAPSTAVTPQGGVPGAPTGVTATAGNASALVSWAAPTNNGGSAITGYTVTSSPGALTCTTTGATTCTVSGLTNGTPYTFTVTATNTNGTGVPSAPSTAVTPAGPPGAPTGVSGTAGNGSVSVSWTAPGSDGGSAITGYTVTSSPGSFTCSSASSPCTVSGLTNGTPYTFTVTATNGIGTGSASTPSSPVTPQAGDPGAPTGVTATAGNASALVSWTAPTNNGGSAITGYTVTSSPGALTCTTTGATSCTVNGLTNGTPYTFTATATNSSGTGPASSPSSAVTPATVPGAPTGVTAVAGNASASVSWTAPASNGGSGITGYTVTSTPGSLTCTSASSPCTVLGLTNGTPYTFTVTATNGQGAGAASAPSTAVTPQATIPGAPTGVTATAANASAVVSWNAPATGGSPITGYTVTSSPGSLTCTTTGATTCTVSGLTNGTPYTFTVTATNAVGTGPLSAASAPVTPSATSSGAIKGYWMVTSNGAVLTNGAAVSFGSPAGLALGAPIVALAPTPDRKGYWVVGANGAVFNYGDAAFYGSAGNLHLAKPIVGMAATSDGKGYWLVASDGGVFAYGDAAFKGSMGGKPLNAPVVGVAGNGTAGYWLVASDGGIFAFGSAAFHGSAGGDHLVAPVVGISALANGSGYYLAAADGGVFAYSAPFLGSASGVTNTPIVGIAGGAAGGYTLVGKSGAVFAYPSGNFYGTQVNSGASAPVVGVAS